MGFLRHPAGRISKSPYPRKSNINQGFDAAFVCGRQLWWRRRRGSQLRVSLGGDGEKENRCCRMVKSCLLFLAPNQRKAFELFC